MGGVTVASGGATRAAGLRQAVWTGARGLYLRHGALAGYAVAALAVFLGWTGRDERNINAGSGPGYALGLIGAALLLLLLLYPVRKRVRALARFGAIRHWFHVHMMLGIIGPVLVLYHCNFELGDLNSRVALFCTLLVVCSGVAGRCLYAGTHAGLYGSKADLQERVARLQKSVSADRSSALIEPIRAELAAVSRRVLTPPATITESVLRPLAISWQTRLGQRRLLNAARRELMRKAMTSAAVDLQADRLEEVISRYLVDNLRLVREVARCSSCERLFALWRVAHVPLVLLMLASALIHVAVALT